MKTIAALSIAGALIAAALPTFAQELVTNGGFEQSTAQDYNTPGDTGDFAPGWVHTLDPLGFDNVGGMPFEALAHSGNQWANLGSPTADGGGMLSQTFTTLVGENYTVTFWLAHDVTDTPSNSFTASWNGTALLSLNNVGTQDYTFYTFSVLGTGSDTLAFTYQDNDDYFRLDDVSVVPEPATWSMLGMGGLATVGMTILRRRRA